MIRIHVICVFAAALLLFSCKQKKGAESSSAVPVTTNDHTEIAPPPGIDTRHTISLDGKNEIHTRNFVTDSLHPDVIYYVEINEGKELHASLTPRYQPANIRFNQIIVPDGKADGPFGQTLVYPVSVKGKYTLRIGPSQMAEGRYHGPAVLKISAE